MNAPLVALDHLPTQTSTRVKNQWGEVVRQVQEVGSVGITSRANVDMVLMTAQAYQELLDTVAQFKERERSELDKLSTEFMARLDSLQAPDAHARLDRVMATKGKASKAPIAGRGFR